MLAARAVQTANFLTVNQHRAFAWGKWDCNIFIAELVDRLLPTCGSRVTDIQGKYSTRREAIRFQRGYVPAPEWLAAQGFVITNKNLCDISDYDIVLESNPGYWTASLAFAGHTWSVIEHQGMARDVLVPGTYMVGELNG
jgi:hypothetical protein